MALEYFLLGIFIGTIISYVSIIIGIWMLVKTERGKQILLGIGIAIAADQIIGLLKKRKSKN